MTYQELADRVVVDPRICAGQPVIRGTRIMIVSILDSLSEGMTAEQIIEHFPRLTPDDIRGAVAFASKITKQHHPEPVEV